MVAPLVLSGVVQASIVSMMAWASQEYARYEPDQKPLTVRTVSAAGDLRQAAVANNPLDATQGELAYPFALFLLGEIAARPGAPALTNTTGTRGVMTNRNFVDGYAEFETMRPVTLTYGVNFRSNSFEDVWRWAHALLLAAPRVQLYVTSDEGFVVECSVELETALTIPPLDSTEQGKYYSFDTTLRLNTRMGVVTRHRLIQRISVEMRRLDGTTGMLSEDYTSLLDRVGYTVHDLYDPTHPMGRYATKKETP